MKFNFCLVIVLGGGLVGCSTTPIASTQVLNYSNGDSTIAVENMVQNLGMNFLIKATADSWTALVQKSKPTFAWNGRDMMRIEADKQGRPQFHLDEAYIFQPTNQSFQWVLLQETTNSFLSRGELPQFFWSCQNLESTATLHNSVPEMHDGGYRGDYAVEKAKHPQFGTVYEVGWQRMMCLGTAHPEYARRIYVLKDQTGQWHFLGEGPEEGWARGGGSTVESRVVWDATQKQKGEPPLRIKFRCEEYSYPDVHEGDTNPPPFVVTTNNYVLAGRFPSRFGKGE